MAFRHIYPREMNALGLHWLPAILAAVLAFVPSLRSADGAAGGQWQSLFNGRNRSGWVSVTDATFVVTNGNLQLVKGMGWLRTETQFTDSILEVEWLALEPGYDGGLFLRARSEGKPWPKDGRQMNLKESALGGLVKGYITVVPAETPRMPVGQLEKFCNLRLQPLLADGNPAAK